MNPSVQRKINQIKAKYRRKRADLISRRDEFANWSKEKIEGFAKDMSDEKAEELWEKRSMYVAVLNKRLSNLLKIQNQEIDQVIQKTTHLTPRQITGVVTATAIIALSIRFAEVVRRDAKEKCMRIKNDRRRNYCIKKYQEQYYKKRLVFLRDHITNCKFSKNPIQCHDKLDKEIMRVEQHLHDIKSEVLEKYADIES